MRLLSNNGKPEENDDVIFDTMSVICDDGGVLMLKFKSTNGIY